LTRGPKLQQKCRPLGKKWKITKVESDIQKGKKKGRSAKSITNKEKKKGGLGRRGNRRWGQGGPSLFAFKKKKKETVEGTFPGGRGEKRSVRRWVHNTRPPNSVYKTKKKLGPRDEDPVTGNITSQKKKKARRATSGNES